MLKLRGLTKAYGPTTVLSDVDVDIHPGEVHALLGPNGSGKTTLIRCISGAVAPTAGRMQLDGNDHAPDSPAEALDAGVVTIHQHLSSVNALSVSDNIFLGSEQSRWGLVDRRHQVRVTRDLLRQFGIAVRPQTRLGDLPIGVRQLVEIAKAWHRNDPRVLILDEPTASLSGPETRRLFERVETMRQRGTCIVYVTHRLDEVFEIADRVTVLRDGAVSLSAKVAEVSHDDVVRAIAPDSRVGTAAGASATFGDVVLDVDQLAGRRFGPISLSVRAGEVVALFGSVGSGRSSLLETLAGVHRATGGEVRLDGSRVALTSPGAARRRGVAFAPSDRATQSSWGRLSARDNLNLPSMRRTASRGFRGFRRETTTFNATAARLGLQPPDPDLEFERFSGGNQQKIVIGRVELVPNLRLVLLDEPTQGVDIGARQQLYAEIRRLAAETGCAVVTASSEPTEVIAVADRAIVMKDGVVVAEHDVADIDEVTLVGASHASTTPRGRA